MVSSEFSGIRPFKCYQVVIEAFKRHENLPLLLSRMCLQYPQRRHFQVWHAHHQRFRLLYSCHHFDAGSLWVYNCCQHPSLRLFKRLFLPQRPAEEMLDDPRIFLSEYCWSIWGGTPCRFQSIREVVHLSPDRALQRRLRLILSLTTANTAEHTKKVGDQCCAYPRMLHGQYSWPFLLPYDPGSALSIGNMEYDCFAYC